MREYLLDANALLALAWPNHPHHRAVHRWLAGVPQRPWATCALTQSAFVRLSCNPRIVGVTVFPRQALDILARNTAVDTHRFWAEQPPVAEVLAPFRECLIGYRQVTDAYLLGLAVSRSGCLVTLDKGLAAIAVDGCRQALEILTPIRPEGSGRKEAQGAQGGV